MKPAFLLLLTAPLAAQDLTPAQTFQIHCSACHGVDRMLVGPSLVEVSGIYRNDPDGFVKWCLQPGHKREGAIEMPSMAHLGEPALRTLHAYILEAAKGKTELKRTEGDPFGVPAPYLRRPQVQRIFLPDASPAAIAVALPGELSYCFDAAECRLRYVWKGGFIDGWPYWQGNGSSQAKIDGEVVYTEKCFPFLNSATDGPDPAPRFLGYKVDEMGLPTFFYTRWGVRIAETIEPDADGKGIIRRFDTGLRGVLVPVPKEVDITLSVAGAVVPATAGQPFLLDTEAARSFTLTFRWK